MMDQQTTHKPRSTQGFTIVELVVSIAVFALLVPALASFLNLLSVLNDRARDTAIVNALAENKVESIRSANFVAATLGTHDFTSELPATITAPRSATYTVTSVSSSLKEVNLSVSYNDHGTTRTLTYRTYIGELGVGQY
jgi:prepilin-type N-terminal cleavage/methylation domain-containing protein